MVGGSRYSGSETPSLFCTSRESVEHAHQFASHRLASHSIRIRRSWLSARLSDRNLTMYLRCGSSKDRNPLDGRTVLSPQRVAAHAHQHADQDSQEGEAGLVLVEAMVRRKHQRERLMWHVS